MKQSHFFLTIIIILSFFIGCSGSEEMKKTDESSQSSGEFKKTDKDEVDIPKTATPPGTEEKTPEADLPQTEKDLPKDVQTPPQNPPQQIPQVSPPQTQPVPPGTTQRTGATMWSVQIGAFKNEAGALQAANEAKQKFNQPVYKDLDPATEFYKVTVGSFQTYDQASKYKLEVQAKGFPDAFPVEVKR